MLVIQRPTVDADRGVRRQPAAVCHRPARAPASATPSATPCAAHCCRRSPAPQSRRFVSTTALHEFDTITGVAEDVTDIILNLKDLVLTVHSEEPVTLRLDSRGPAEVTAE